MLDTIGLIYDNNTAGAFIFNNCLALSSPIASSHMKFAPIFIQILNGCESVAFPIFNVNCTLAS